MYAYGLTVWAVILSTVVLVECGPAGGEDGGMNRPDAAAPRDGGPDASACSQPGEGCACTAEDGVAECGPFIGYGAVCSGGTWQVFVDGPCAPPPVGGGAPLCGDSPEAGCACDTEGQAACQAAGWQLVCTGGMWTEQVGRMCC